MGTINDINGRGLVDTEEIKRWKEYMEELYKKDPNEPDGYSDVVSHPEPDILERDVKWALGNTAVDKGSGCNRIPVELFKTLKDDAIKVLHSICQQIWKTQQWPQDRKRSTLIPVPKKGSTKECANHWTIALISYASKVMLKSCMLGFSIMQTKNFQMFKLGLEKEEELEIKLPTFAGSERKLGNSRKTSTSVSSTTPKPLIMWIIINCGKLLERWEHQTILPVSWETVKKQQFPVWNNWLGQDWERSTTGLSAVTVFV